MVNTRANDSRRDGATASITPPNANAADDAVNQRPPRQPNQGFYRDPPQNEGPVIEQIPNP
jgi:hypothetical protein